MKLVKEIFVGIEKWVKYIIGYNGLFKLPVLCMLCLPTMFKIFMVSGAGNVISELVGTYGMSIVNILESSMLSIFVGAMLFMCLSGFGFMFLLLSAVYFILWKPISNHSDSKEEKKEEQKEVEVA